MSNQLLPPQSISSELALIGAVLIDPETLDRLAFDPIDFYAEKHRWIWAAIQGLKVKGSGIDFITVQEELTARKKLEAVGGAPALLQAIAECSSPYNAPSYASVVTDRAIRRRVLQDCSVLASKAYDETADLQTAISAIMESLSKTVVIDKGAKPISDFLSLVWDQIEAAQHNPQEIYGLATGFRDIDGLTKGLQLGETVKLSGEPGVGKSVLAFQIILNIARSGIACAVYSPEMSGISLARRGLSSLSNIRTDAIRSGRMTADEFDTIGAVFDQMAGLPIYISDASHMTTLDIRVDLLRLKDRAGVQVGEIDYEGLLEDEIGRLDDIDRSKIVSGRVHAMFKDLSLAGIVIDDMNKAGISGQQSGKAGLSGSARKLHDADQIVIMTTDKDNDQLVNLKWEKNREGDNKQVVQLIKCKGFPAFIDKPAAAKDPYTSLRK